MNVCRRFNRISNLMGASLAEDGFFGPQTQGAVMRFRRVSG